MSAINSLQPLLGYAKKYKRFIGAGTLVLIYFIFANIGASKDTEQETLTTYTVKSGTIENSIKVLGNTEITDQQVLTFGQEGTVKTVYVHQGQKVKKGDLLAELDKKSLKKDIAQQSLSIQSARLNYQKLLKKYTETDKIKAQNDVDDTQRKLTMAKKELQDMMLDQGNTLQTQAASVQSTLLSTQSLILDTRNILDSVDQIFGFTNKWSNLNEDISIYISAKNSSYKTSTESYFYSASNKLSQLETLLSSIKRNSSTTIQIMDNLQAQNKDFLENMSNMISSAKNAVDSSITSTTLPQSKIDSRSSMLISSSSKIISLLSSINNDTKTRNATENDIQNKKNDIKNYETQLAIYKETLQTVLSGPESEDKLLQINSIKQAEISLSKLSEQAENYELLAPFDGSIDVIDLQKGDNITMDNISEKGITISNPDIYQISMLIDQVDIVKINDGQITEISFDAYPGYTVTGIISGIDPTPTINAGVVSYSAKINMKKGEKKVYDSMTVTVKIITEKKENILIVPLSAVTTTGNHSFVSMQRNGQTRKVSITLGAKNSTESEVISGLSIGDIILLKGYSMETSNKKNTNNTTDKQTGTNDVRSSTRGLGVGGSSSRMPEGPGF